MSFGETLAQARRNKKMTQGELAEKLYVTRQAVSRWENGETTPGIDMVKLIAVMLEVPVTQLLELPEHPVCQSCGMPLTDLAEVGTEADGSASPDFCKHCYDQGKYRYEATMDELIEGCAPFLVQHAGMSLDEAVSLMGVMLPGLKRWHAVRENEALYGREARERYGDRAVDETNRRLLEMDENAWNTKEELEAEIIERLRAVREQGDTQGDQAMELARLHAEWIKMHWGEDAYSLDAHDVLASSYTDDPRFVEYYDSRAGAGATAVLAKAISTYCVRQA